jgi:hypothetical protein
VTAPLPPADLRSRVLATAGAERVAPNTVGARRSALIVAAGIAVSVAILYSIGGPGARERPVGYYFTLAFLWLGVGLVATWAGVSRGRSMLGRPPSWQALVAVLTPAALLATAVVAGLAWPATLDQPTDMSNHLSCVEFSLLMALGPLLAFAFVRRGSDPVAPRLTGAAIGAASGAWGALCIELRCDHPGVTHVMLSHALPVIFLALVGWLLGDRVIAVRARS